MVKRPRCPFCGGESNLKQKLNNRQQWKCKICKKHYMDDTLTSAKILVFDIETSPIEGYVWGAWKQNVYLDQIKQDWFMLSWSAKWLNDCDILGECLTSKEALNKDDKKIVKSLWRLFDEADILIAHHGKKFDIPKSNQRFLANGLTPPSPYLVVDTRELAKRQFDFTHNKLDFIASLMGMDRKIPTDFKLWADCMQGDKRSLDYMLKYNKMDVLILEEIYLGLRGWSKSHPNLGNYDDEFCCSVCASKDLIKKASYKTQLNTYKTYKCNNCGAYSRQGRKKLTSIAR